jgi:PAS domain S-box-containing protein
MFWSADGTVTDANDAFLGIIGSDRDALAAGTIKWPDLTPPEFAEADARAAQEIAERGACTPYEKELTRSDGSRVPILIGTAVFADSTDEGLCFVVDLSERKKLEQQFYRAQRMESIGTLAGGIAHDLNNVFTPIMMSVELLRETATDEESRDMLAMLQRSARHGADLVQQVLLFARGAHGTRIPVSPNYVLGDLVTVLLDTFPKSINVEFAPSRDLWTVSGDPTQLHQVFLNLCVNSRDAMPDGGRLTIAAENVVLDETYTGMHIDAAPGRYVMVSVADTGTGIPREIQDRIFEPFFTTKETGRGTGLGLSTALSIVKQHGGFVHLYSEPGGGTKFKVHLPAGAEGVIDRPLSVEPLRLPRGQDELVLIIDDEESVRKVASATLNRFGYRTLLAANGAEGVAMYAQNAREIAVVLTDMAMPVMDGPATIVALRSIDPSVRIIGSSGLSSEGGLARATGSGVKHFIPKPYTAETILKVLRQVLAE